MTKEYDSTITKDYAAYSNINSYGNNGRPVSIVAPVTASFLPEIFYHMRPHPLPQWMTPKKQGTNCNQYPYQSASSHTCGSDYTDNSDYSGASGYSGQNMRYA